ncbi:sulfatase-like hydrolase/transferase [Pseudonocardia endophytica]|uniref:Phosphoglycerol transferase MdoB-like AlkP superfamily enzyme n=1 Tax=Pseudonocardia endophytica TaxID=401976 RepID=A0A4R1HTA7_PSEEN|nr:sulfatase-like hydrolase/transferase [Pseudonocardia endophytica]TCK25897.1 phosphoglycerol transferase MdoB-like AlkP superfamily enzyme [Pseudonocardia endophytica]
MTTTLPRPVRTAPSQPRHRSRLLTAGAALLLFVALVLPREIGQLGPAAFLRLPVEGLVAALLVLVLPPRAGRRAATAGGVLLAGLTVLRAIDMGFLAALGRPFDPIADWAQVGSGVSFVEDSAGSVAAVAAVVVACLLAVALAVLMALSARRLARVVRPHRLTGLRTVAVLAACWVTLAALGAQLVAPVPLASRSVASLITQKAQQIPQSIADQRAFAARFATDPYRGVPGKDLLGGLRGKDVLVTFVESYGRSAVEDPAIAPSVTPTLDDGTRRLAASGFSARSAWLTSPIAGGGSWMAHATFQSGLRVSNQKQFEQFAGSDRVTLSGAFKEAGWETAAVMPGTSGPWPEGRVYDFDRVHPYESLGYRGTAFGGFHTPDQYTLAAYERLEHGRPGRGPLMTEIPLLSSHWPFGPIPQPVDWSGIGDGSVFDAQSHAPDPGPVGYDDPLKMKAEYGRSIAYSLDTLVSYLQLHGDDDTVLVFLGDHQPTPAVTGSGASKDVPVTIVARDPTVLDRISGWGWQPGLKPGPDAPVWRMEDVRDRFLSAFAR